jgi:signal transduction histidine kinase
VGRTYEIYLVIGLTAGPGLLYALLADLLLPPGFGTESPRNFATAIVTLTVASILWQCAVRFCQMREIREVGEQLDRLVSGDHKARVRVRPGRIGKLATRANDLALKLEHAKRDALGKDAEHDKSMNELQGELRKRSLYLASLTRELQDPIYGILEASQQIGEQDLDDSIQETVDHVLVAGHSLLVTLQDLADFSSLQAGALEIRQDVFNLHDAIRESIAEHVLPARDKSLALKCKIAKNVPTEAVGDEERFCQVLGNFLDNAIKYTDEGEVSVLATVDKSRSVKATVRISVMDTGPGIDRERQESLFADPHDTDKEEGAAAQEGLGLATCRDLAELMGGTVGVRTSDGQGSAFWFTVTVGKHVSSGNEIDGADVVPSTTRELPIMVFTDDPDLSAQVLMELSKAGFAAEFEQIRGNLTESLQRSQCGMVLLDGERPDLVAMMASWRPDGEAMQIPAVGIPKHSDGTLHRPYLSSLIHEWMGEEERIDLADLPEAGWCEPEGEDGAEDLVGSPEGATQGPGDLADTDPPAVADG